MPWYRLPYGPGLEVAELFIRSQRARAQVREWRSGDLALAGLPLAIWRPPMNEEWDGVGVWAFATAILAAGIALGWVLHLLGVV